MQKLLGLTVTAEQQQRTAACLLAAVGGFLLARSLERARNVTKLRAQVRNE